MFRFRVLILLTFFFFTGILLTQFKLHADPTMNGGKGQLRILSADSEPFSPGMPFLYFSFYQGYVNEKVSETSEESERTLSNTFTLTFILTPKLELSTAIKGMIFLSTDKLIIDQNENQWRLKYLAYQYHSLSIALAPDISFPIGESKEATSKFGGYLLGTLNQQIVGNRNLEFNMNIGFLSSEEFMTPFGFSTSLVTKFSEFFVEYSADNLSASDYEMRVTPGIRLNPGKGLTFTVALDKTFSTPYPDKRLNLLVSWLGPFSVMGAERK